MEQNSNPYDMFLWPALAAIFLIAVSMGYSHYRPQINSVIMTANDAQMAIISYLPGTDEVKQVRVKLGKRHPGSFRWEHMQAQINYVAKYTRWPVMLFIIFLAWRSSVRGTNYQRILQMKTLVQSNVEIFPCMAPVAWRDIDKEPIDKGPWRLARQPIQWAIENKLLVRTIRNDKGGKDKILIVKAKEVLNRWGVANQRSAYLKPEKNKELSIDREKAATQMEAHLGAAFESISTLPDYQRGLVAAFIAFGAGKKDEANDLVNQMALSFVEEGKSKKDPAKDDLKQLMEIDVRGCDDTIKNYTVENKEIREEFEFITQHHRAFTYPFIHACLEFARKKGVFECSKFIWLKPTNRTLWYVLNQAGRRTPWAEAAGEFTHYQAEEAIEQSIEEPELDKAIDGLRDSLMNEGWLPEKGA